MQKAVLLFCLLAPALVLADPPLKTVYSSTQTTSFSSSNFGNHVTITTLYPDNGFWGPAPSRRDCCCGLWVRAWDDPRLPFEFQNDLYVKNWLALGYFFHPGERAYLYPAYAR